MFFRGCLYCSSLGFCHERAERYADVRGVSLLAGKKSFAHFFSFFFFASAFTAVTEFFCVYNVLCSRVACYTCVATQAFAAFNVLLRGATPSAASFFVLFLFLYNNKCRLRRYELCTESNPIFFVCTAILNWAIRIGECSVLRYFASPRVFVLLVETVVICMSLLLCQVASAVALLKESDKWDKEFQARAQVRVG